MELIRRYETLQNSVTCIQTKWLGRAPYPFYKVRWWATLFEQIGKAPSSSPRLMSEKTVGSFFVVVFVIILNS